MDLDLERGDLLQLDPISARNTLRLFPVGKKGRQKLVVGDDAGFVGCYDFSKGDPRKVFVSRPFEGPVSSVSLGSSTASPTLKDEVVASSGQSIVRITKKGKEVARLTSSRTEPINHVATMYPRVWMGCECIYSFFDNGIESDLFYMAKNQILCLVVDNITRDYDRDIALGCQDNCIRIIHGAELALEVPTSSAVTALVVMPCSESVGGTKVSSRILYGTENGSLSLISIFPRTQPQQAQTQTAPFVLHWTLQDQKRSQVNSLSLSDVTRDGGVDVLVGREDGRVEVFGQDRLQTPSSSSVACLGVNPPSRRFSRDIGESVKTVDCGLLNSTAFNEVVLASYSGKVISYTTEPVRQRAQDDTYGRSVQVLQNERRIIFLNSELKELRKTIETARGGKAAARKGSLLASITGGVVGSSSSSSSYSSSSSSGQGQGQGQGQGDIPQDFPTTAKFALDPESGLYQLSIEVQAPIDMLVLRSPVALDLADAPPHAAAATSNALVSTTPSYLLEPLSSEEHPCRFLAAVRPPSAQERRISLFIRPTEGEAGDILVTVVTAGTPKMGKMMRFPLKPLSLHHRMHALTQDEEDRPKHYVKFQGTLPSLSPSPSLPLSLSASLPLSLSLSHVDVSFVASCRYQSPSSGDVSLRDDRGSIKAHKQQGPRA